MNITITTHPIEFELQADVELFNGITDWVDGPDRAYLIYPATDHDEEVAALWVLDDAVSNEALAAVLAINEPSLSKAKPWFVHWISNGRLYRRKEAIGIDRGVHLLLTLADYDVLDRQSHLFWPRQ